MRHLRILVTAIGAGAAMFVAVTLYLLLLNWLGPSTEYHDPYITNASTGPDNVYFAYLGDKIYVNYTIIRHQINGVCMLNVYRYGEEIGGNDNGKKHILDYTDLQFPGQNDLLHAHWPLAGLVLGYDVDKDGHPQKDKPLLAPGVDVQRYALYVMAEYHCNYVDDFSAWMGHGRYLQGGPVPNETERVLLDVRRKR